MTLRPETQADRGFLLELYASTRADELAILPWSDNAKHAFVTQQFTAQEHHYLSHYADASFDVVLVDGRPAGRLCVWRAPQHIHLVDIALLPAARGRGIGARLVTALIDEARTAGKSLTLHVLSASRAVAFYQRLGFAAVDADGMHTQMDCVRR